MAMNDADKETGGAEPELDALLGVPGLGPVRRRLLSEAGITTRATLAVATPEQLIAATGMPRAAADGVHAFLVTDLLAAKSITVVAAPDDPKEADTVDSDDPTEPMGEEMPQATRLEIAALRAQTVIADASRHAAPGSKLAAMLAGFARLADDLPHRVPSDARPGVLRRVAERLEAISARLDVAAKGEPDAILPPKRAKRLRARIKRTRDTIKRTLKAARHDAPQPPAVHPVPAVPAV